GRPEGAGWGGNPWARASQAELPCCRDDGGQDWCEQNSSPRGACALPEIRSRGAVCSGEWAWTGDGRRGLSSCGVLLHSRGNKCIRCTREERGRPILCLLPRQNKEFIE